MLYSYTMNKESIYKYNTTFLKRINKPRNKTIILNFSLVIFLIFSVVSYFSITPTLLFLYKKSNYPFIISLIICIILIYIIVRNFFKSSNYIRVISQGILINDFYKDGYIINLDDESKYLEVQTQYIKITLNILEDLEKNSIHMFKDFISITFNKNTIFLPNEKSILYLFKKNNLI